MTKVERPMSVKEGTEGNSATLGRILSRMLGHHSGDLGNPKCSGYLMV